MTKAKEKAGALIIRNLRLFEDASKLLQFEIERPIFDEIDRIAEQWANDHKWVGTFDWWNDQLSLVPKGWILPETDNSEYQARFEFWLRHGDDEGDTEKSDYWYLTRLCGVGSNSIGFKWYEEPEVIGTQGNRRKWKEFIRERADPFIEMGFEFEEERGRFFLPVVLDQEKLAVSYENSAIEDALLPIHEALDKIGNSVKAFTDVLTVAKREFGKKSK